MDRRVRLLAAAEQIVAKRGKTTEVAHITAAADLPKSAFYSYFSDVDHIVRALQQQVATDFVRDVTDPHATATQDDWWPTFDGFITAFFDHHITHRDWHRIRSQGWDLASGPEGLQSRRQGLDQGLDQGLEVVLLLIQAGMVAGDCHAEDPELIGTLLYRAMEGTAHHFVVTDGAIERDRLVKGTQQAARALLSS